MPIFRIPHVRALIESPSGRHAEFTKLVPRYEVAVMRSAHSNVRGESRTIKVMPFPAKPVASRDPFADLRSRTYEADSASQVMALEENRLKSSYKTHPETKQFPFDMAYRAGEFEEIFRRDCAALFEQEVTFPDPGTAEDEVCVELTAGEREYLEAQAAEPAEPAKKPDDSADPDPIPEDAEDALCALVAVDTVRARTLYHMGLRTVEDVAAADIEELMTLPRVGKTTALAISESALDARDPGPGPGPGPDGDEV